MALKISYKISLNSPFKTQIIKKLNRKEAYKYTQQLVEAIESLNSNVFNYKGLNLVKAGYSEIYVCIINYFSQSPKPWVVPAKAGNKFIQLLKRIKNFRINKKFKASKIVFFQVSSTNHIKQQYPVVLALKDMGYESVFISNKKYLTQLLRNKGLLVINSIPIAHMSDNAAILMREQVLSITHKLDWFSPELASRVADILESVYSTASGLKYDIEKAINRFSPQIILIGNDILRDGYLSAQICKMNNVKTAGIMHAIMTDDNLVNYNINVDYYFIFGEYFRKYFNLFGLSNEQLFISGAPVFGTEEIKVDINSKLGLKPDVRYILVALSGPGHSHSEEQHKQTVSIIKAVIEKMPNSQFVIKLHQKDNKLYYNSIIEAGLQNVIIISDKENGFEDLSIVNFFASASALVSVISTTIFEAMYLNIPALSIDVWDEYSALDYLDDKLVWRVTNPQDAVNSLLQMNDLNNDITKNKIAASGFFAHNVFGPNDGKAPERIAKSIDLIVQ